MLSNAVSESSEALICLTPSGSKRGSLIYSSLRKGILLFSLIICAPVLSAKAGDTLIRPRFSWNTVPQWLIVRKATSFNQNELKLLAGAPLVVFEKVNGYEDSGSVERGILRAASALKQVSPTTITLFYWNAVISYPHYESNSFFVRNKEKWALSKGGKYYRHRGRNYVYNLLDKDQQAWWINVAKRMSSYSSIDGIFIDAIVKTNSADGDNNKVYPTIEYGKAYFSTAMRLNAELGNKLLIGNVIRVSEPNSNLKHLKYLDGSYIERWDVPVGGQSFSSYVSEGMKAISKALSDGKIILFNSAPSRQQDTKHWTRNADYASREKLMKRDIRFPFAVFLMVAEEGAFFHWGTGPNVATTSEPDIWRNDIYEELRRPLGKPLAPSVKIGSKYFRRFEYLDVMLDLDQRTSEFCWHKLIASQRRAQARNSCLL